MLDLVQRFVYAGFRETHTQFPADDLFVFITCKMFKGMVEPDDLGFRISNDDRGIGIVEQVFQVVPYLPQIPLGSFVLLYVLL